MIIVVPILAALVVGLVWLFFHLYTRASDANWESDQAYECVAEMQDELAEWLQFAETLQQMVLDEVDGAAVDDAVDDGWPTTISQPHITVVTGTDVGQPF